VAFDLLEDASGVHIDAPFAERRVRLEAAASSWKPPFFLTPATADVAEARDWFETFEGAGMDGVMAKPVLDPYEPGKRTLVKVKHKRTADCVVAGYREHKSGPVVGSLLLGLYDDEGRLQHMGVCSSFTAARRKELVEELAPLVVDFADHPWSAWAADEAGTRRPGMVNRWNSKKDMTFVPLRPERVVEVAYDQIQGNYRFRHNPRFVRWRPDREPKSCRFDQLERPVSYDVGDVLRRGRPLRPRAVRQDGQVSRLIVLTENALTEHDVTRIVEWHEGDLDVHVLVPETSDQSRFDQVVDDIARVDGDELRRDLARADDGDESVASRRALSESLDLLAAKGIVAKGALTPKDPVPATAAAVTSEDADELWVVTEPHLVSDLLRRDWASKLRHLLSVPVLHVIGGTDEVIN
jgi:hypothetical protein